MFKITEGKGFHITFKNDTTVSVQFGPGNYCENQSPDKKNFLHVRGISKDAEIAIWDKNGEWITDEYFGGSDVVKGHVDPEELLGVLVWVQDYEKFHLKLLEK